LAWLGLGFSGPGLAWLRASGQACTSLVGGDSWASSLSCGGDAQDITEHSGCYEWFPHLRNYLLSFDFVLRGLWEAMMSDCFCLDTIFD